MASAELQVLIDMMREVNPLGSGDIDQIREGMAAAPPYPKPDDVTWTPVDAGGVEAEWTDVDGGATDRAIVYYHGGGYVIGGIESHHGLCSHLARETRSRVLNVGYRLAPESPFPAAVDDAVAAYRFAVAQGIEPAKIALAGDSAGGGLVLGTLIALRDAGDPLPGAGVCISPWVDMTLSSPSFEERAALDPMVQRDVLEIMASAYMGDADRKSPTASPLFGKLEGLPPVLIQVGTAEVLFDEAHRFAEAARSAGVDVTLEAWDDMIHVWHTFADMLPEGLQAIQAVAQYLSKRLG